MPPTANNGRIHQEEAWHYRLIINKINKSSLNTEGHWVSHQKVRKTILNILLTLHGFSKKKKKVLRFVFVINKEFLQYSIYISSGIYHGFFWRGWVN